MCFTLSSLLFLQGMIIQRQPGKGLFPSRCLSPRFYLVFSLTHTGTHTRTDFSGLPVQHYLSITTAISHIPAQCSPKHFITFIKGLHTGAGHAVMGRENTPDQWGHGQDTVDDMISSEQTPAPMLSVWVYSCYHLLSKNGRCGAWIEWI